MIYEKPGKWNQVQYMRPHTSTPVHLSRFLIFRLYHAAFCRLLMRVNSVCVHVCLCRWTPLWRWILFRRRVWSAKVFFSSCIQSLSSTAESSHIPQQLTDRILKFCSTKVDSTHTLQFCTFKFYSTKVDPTSFNVALLSFVQLKWTQHPYMLLF